MRVIGLPSVHSINSLREVRTKLATYMYPPCKRNSNFEIRIEGYSCCPQYNNDKLYSSVV